MAVHLPRGVAQALVALGVLAAVALPALTGAFAWRLANGFGVDVVPREVVVQPLENATRVAFVFSAFEEDESQELTFRGGTGVLRYRGLQVPLESATGRATCEPAPCFRGLAYTFLLPRGPFSGEWELEATATWRSETLGRVESTMGIHAEGEDARFAS